MSWKNKTQEAYWKKHHDDLCAYRREKYRLQLETESEVERAARLQRQRIRNKTYREKHKERIRQRSKQDARLYRYGITTEQVKILWVKQNKQCTICGTSLEIEQICVDHDHVTQKFRGIICRKCNLGLGHFCDNPYSLLRAYEYLCH